MDVAIAGASGIGKHHAKWFHQAGARVVGFLGSNEERVAATSEALRAIFPFSGRGYWDFDRLLVESGPMWSMSAYPTEPTTTVPKGHLRMGAMSSAKNPWSGIPQGRSKRWRWRGNWSIWRGEPTAAWVFALNMPLC